MFGLLRLLGFDYQPQLADLADQKLWRADLTANYGPLNAAARGRIDLAKIATHWPDMLRVAASIHTGAIAAQDALRVLALRGTLTQLGEALAHYGRIFKTRHVLAYRHVPPLSGPLATVTRRFPGTAALSFTRPLRRPGGKVFHLHSNMQRLVAHSCLIECEPQAAQISWAEPTCRICAPSPPARTARNLGRKNPTVVQIAETKI